MDGRQRVLLSSAAVLGWIGLGLSLGGAVSAVRAQEPSVSDIQCDLETCWKKLSPQAVKLGDQVVQALNHYEQEIRAEVSRSENREQPEAERLSYQLALLRSYLEECEELATGLNQPRHLILVGYEYYDDGSNNHKVAETLHAEILAKACPPDKSIDGCEKRVAIKTQLNRSKLYRYLRLLGPQSLKSLSYAGHGTERALTLGAKDPLFPITWTPDLKISYHEWLQRNQAMVYDDTLDEIALDLRRILAPDAKIQLYACHTGVQFAPRLKAIVQKPTVEACILPMHYEYQDASGSWRTDWDRPVPLDAKRTRLVPDGVPQDFAAVDPGQLPDGALGGKRVIPNNDAKADISDAKSDAAFNVIYRLLLGTGREAQIDGGKRVIVFNPTEENLLRKVFADIYRRKNLDHFTYASFAERMDKAIESTESGSDREVLQKLREKIDTCVDESMRLYY